MSSYLVGIAAAFAEPVLHAWSNIIDNHLSNKIFNRLTSLIFFSTVVGLFVLPILWFLDRPSGLSLQTGSLMFVISALSVLCLYPYYWALRHTDTSIVTSLFSIGQMLVPILAFIFIGERLSWLQYVGFFILTIASFFVTFDWRKIHMNKALPFMFLCSAMLAVKFVLLKHAYEIGVGWGTSVSWMIIFEFLIMLCFMFAPSNFREIKDSKEKFKGAIFLLVGMEILNWGGALGSTYGLYRIPVSVSEGIISTQAIFVLIYALIFSRIWPDFFKEYLGGRDVLRKVALFIVMIVGTVLVTGV